MRKYKKTTPHFLLPLSIFFSSTTFLYFLMPYLPPYILSQIMEAPPRRPPRSVPEESSNSTMLRSPNPTNYGSTNPESSNGGAPHPGDKEKKSKPKKDPYNPLAPGVFCSHCKKSKVPNWCFYCMICKPCCTTLPKSTDHPLM